MNKLLVRITKSFYGKGFFRDKIAKKIINKYDGGEYYSKVLRDIFKEKYDIDAGIGTYGCFTSRFRNGVKIGNYCSIANDVDRLVGNHPYSFCSTHPFFYSPKFGFIKDDKYCYSKLEIGNDVWIGTKVTITGSVKRIGDGAIIGANAVVTHDVDDYAIVAGVPARIIAYRFDQETIFRLKNSEWYKLDPSILKEVAELADNVDLFLEKVEEIKNARRENKDK